MATSPRKPASAAIEWTETQAEALRAAPGWVHVASPKLMEVSCTTPEQMALVNTMCWFVAAAKAAVEELQRALQDA